MNSYDLFSSWLIDTTTDAVIGAPAGAVTMSVALRLASGGAPSYVCFTVVTPSADGPAVILALSKDRSTETAPKDYGFGLVLDLQCGALDASKPQGVALSTGLEAALCAP